MKKYSSLMVLLIFSAFIIAGFRNDSVRAKFEPPAGKILLVIGQDIGAIGGFPFPDNEGYTDKIKITPGGVTTYTSLPSLGGLESEVNYGAGKTCAQCIADNPTYTNSVISIGLYMVNEAKSVGEGTYDVQVKNLGKWIKKINRPVFLRIGYEFDGAWNHYDTAEYKKAYRRIVDLFKTLEVTNCAYVWQSSTSPVDDLIEGTHEDISAWYPGDEYVDWMGYSWFINTPKQVELTDELLNFARERKKPVMVCESSSQGYDIANLTKRNIAAILDGPAGEGRQKKKAEEIWSEWFDPFFSYIDKNKDVIKIVSYINANWDAQRMWGAPYKEGYWGDSRVEANKYIKTKWVETISSGQWLNAYPQLFQQLNFEREERRR